MTKRESEPKVRALIHDWLKETGQPSPPGHMYSFPDFTTWLERKGYGELLKFRSTGGPLYAAEMWFDNELRQGWRN